MPPLYRRMNSPGWLARIKKGLLGSLGVLMRLAVVAAVCLSMVGLALATDAQAGIVKKSTNIPAQGLGPALKTLAKDRGFQVVFRSEVVGSTRTQGATGNLTTPEALTKLLEGTNLSFSYLDENTVTIMPRDELESGAAEGPQDTPVPTGGPNTPSDKEKQKSESFRVAQVDQGKSASDVPLDKSDEQSKGKKAEGLEEIVVTGSRIRGAPSASPVVIITQQQMVEAGQTSLGDVVRSIPQNFSGGQNPGVAAGTGATNPSNGDVTGASAINLRGLGPDATLTLLNGRRLSYDSFGQAVDLSVIPVAAIDRIEIVTDGASALYGSDAVAGVANVILKRDYEGVSATARVGKATDGGDFQQQYSLVGGHKWSSGGFIVTYNNENDQPIYANQREYTSFLEEPYTILSANRSQGVVVSGHQDLGALVTFNLDSLYNHRTTTLATTSSPTFTAEGTQKTTSYTVSPTLDLKLPRSWTVSVNGTYGRDESNTDINFGSSATGFSQELYCECNRETSAELDAEGALVRLPGGESRAAAGAGYRVNTYREDFVGQTVNTHGSRSSRYVFGELFVPLVSSEQNILYVDRLFFTAAGRYERYSDFGGVETPKLSVLYAPAKGVELKGSWGRSFKTPTLSQEFQGTYAILSSASSLGANGYPPNATALYTLGGNLDLRPERATTWDATVDWRPDRVAGLSVEASYFNIVYSDRVVSPIAVISAAFSDPVYRQFVTYSPTAAQQQAIINGASLGFYNFSGFGYSPADVVGFVNGVQTNATSQNIEGVDLSINYHFNLAGGELILVDTSSWLASRQQTSSLSPEVALSGTVYNPPHWRSRAGATWSFGQATVSAFYNYLGGVHNVLVTPNQSGKAMNTLDFAAIYRVKSEAYVLRNVNLALAVQNVTGAKPPYLDPSATAQVNYDSTNYSAVGRFVSLSITKGW
jgi:iron complex outermembrane recepter protein